MKPYSTRPRVSSILLMLLFVAVVVAVFVWVVPEL